MKKAFTHCAMIAWTIVATIGIASAGGEHGNGIFIEYRNYLNQVEMKYPERWQYFEVGSTVQFSDPLRTQLQRDPFVNVHLIEQEEIENSGDLQILAKQIAPTLTWQKLKWKGREALQAGTGDKGQILVFKKPGNVFHIQYQRNSEPETFDTIQKMLDSLKIDLEPKSQ